MMYLLDTVPQYGLAIFFKIYFIIYEFLKVHRQLYTICSHLFLAFKIFYNRPLEQCRTNLNTFFSIFFKVFNDSFTVVGVKFVAFLEKFL